MALNLAGLAMLVGGVLYLNQFREGLIDLRIAALRTQGEIIAAAIAESASTPESIWLEPAQARRILARLVTPTRIRARLFDRPGRLIADTRLQENVGEVRRMELPPPGAGFVDVVTRLSRAYDRVARALWGDQLPLYREYVGQSAADYPEATVALNGAPGGAVRANSDGEIVVTVAVPVQRLRVVLGALMLSTEGEDLEAIVRAERWSIIQVFLVAAAVVALMSLLLAQGVARPIRRLAAAAARGAVTAGRFAKDRVEIPDFSRRRDEIGDLSAALLDLTDALYTRIAEIEEFAADVAHELKNPLTSIRSAVETLEIARDESQQRRLRHLIADDVRRLDRLISDISDASRLDAELARSPREAIDLGGLAVSLADAYRDRAPEREPQVVADVDEEARKADRLAVDALDLRIGQVMRNIVDNALSFSPDDGVVRIAVRRIDDKVVTIIEDDGPGVPTESLTKIFDRFYSHRPEGHGFGRHSGLGLSICKQIIDAHDGLIRAENRRQGGARFVVELPAR